MVTHGTDPSCTTQRRPRQAHLTPEQRPSSGAGYRRPFQRVRRRTGTTLGPTEYLRIRDTVTGEMCNERGPKLYLPAATEEVVEQLAAIPLKRNQYGRLIDTHTGAIRVRHLHLSTLALAPVSRSSPDRRPTSGCREQCQAPSR
jgi:hypothetical protein